MGKIHSIKRWSVMDTRRKPENQVYELVVFRREDETRFLAKVEQGWTSEDRAKSKYKPLLDLDSLDNQMFDREVERHIGMLESVGCVLKEVDDAEREAEAPETGQGI